MEHDLGLEFPLDYKVLVSTYGLGWWGQEVCVHSPFYLNAAMYGGNDPRSEFADWHACHRKSSRIQAAKFPDPAVYSHVVCRNHDDPGTPIGIWPEPGGVLVVGGTITGNTIAWRTVGQPDQWTVLAAFPRQDKFIEYPMGIAAFIHLLLDEPETSRQFWGVVGGPPVFHPMPLVRER